MFSTPHDNWLWTAWPLFAVCLVPVALALLVRLGRIPLQYNLRNLVVRWKTTVLTALAFTLVIGLLTVMLGFVNGMARLAETSGQPGNVVILSEGMTDETFSNLGYSDAKDIPYQPGVLRRDNRPVYSAETYVVVNQPLVDPPPGRPKRRFVQVRGIDDAALSGSVHAMELQPGGRWISDAGVQALPAAKGQGRSGMKTANEVVLGAGIASELGRDRPLSVQAAAHDPERLAVGDRFRLGNHDWVVVGVMSPSGSAFDSEVWAKGDAVRQLFGKNSYTSLVLRCTDTAEAEKVKEFFNKRFKKAAVQGLIETEYFASLSETSRQFLGAIIVVVVIMAVGGILGVMNTMFAAISQRTKDIGVLRIVGFARWQILISFLLESLLLALVGGLLGLALGWCSDGLTATSILSSGQGGGKFVVLRLTVDGQTLLAGLTLTVAMGFLGGLLPAIRAVRLKPLEALR